jgi:hypothetical protein
MTWWAAAAARASRSGWAILLSAAVWTCYASHGEPGNSDVDSAVADEIDRVDSGVDNGDADAERDASRDDHGDADSFVEDVSHDGGDWEALPPGCEFVFPRESVACGTEPWCPAGWRYCCGTNLCAYPSGDGVAGCCNDLVCGTGGEPVTYRCREAPSSVEVVATCSDVRCPADKPFCCYTAPLSVCVDHPLFGWDCRTP